MRFCPIRRRTKQPDLPAKTADYNGFSRFGKVLFSPGAVGVAAQVGVGKAAVGGDFLSQPVGARIGRGFVRQFQFRHNQGRIGAEKFVDFKQKTLRPNMVAVFFHLKRTHARQHGFGIRRRDFVFVFAAHEVGNIAFYREPGAVADDAHADGALLLHAQIALMEDFGAADLTAPAVVME